MLADHVLGGLEKEEVEKFQQHVDAVEVYAAAAGAETPDAVIKQLLRKLHVNLGHPSSDVFLRVLRNGQASTRALELARELQCDVCDGRTICHIVNFL